MNFEQTPEFRKDVKRLSKKWHLLSSDIKALHSQLNDLYLGEENLVEFRAAFFNGRRAAILTQNDVCEVIKMRLDVLSLNMQDKVRIVFVAVKAESKIYFVELFAKNDKDREDPSRYKKYLSG